MEVPLFEQVGEAVRALTPAGLGQVRTRAHRRGVKVWFDTEKPGREHFEAQILARRHVDGTEGMALEVGFHAEHKDLDRNVQVIERIESRSDTWREGLGTEAEIATFYDADQWRRVSEAWIEPDLDDPDLVFEIATRLVDYLAAIEPARHP